MAKAYDNLIRFSDTNPNEIVPDLAERWEISTDGKTITFYLRKGIKFHNGNPFDADDVKANVDRVLNPAAGLKSGRIGMWKALEIQQVEKADTYTARVHFKEPKAIAPTLFASGWTVVQDGETLAREPLFYLDKENGTGPFKLKEAVRGVSMDFERNAEYWMQGRPYLDGVKMITIPDNSARFAAFRSGRSAFMELTPDQYRTVQSTRPDLVTDVVPSLSPRAFCGDISKPPWNNLKFRQALAYAVDMEAANMLLFDSLGTIAGFLPPTGRWGLTPEEISLKPGHSTDPARKAADMEKAKQLFRESGVGKGHYVLTTRNSKVYIDFLQVVEDAWKRLSPESTFEHRVLETAAYFESIFATDFHLISIFHDQPMDDPSYPYYQHLHTAGIKGGENGCRISFPELDAMIDRQAATMDPVERNKVVRDTETWLFENAVKIVGPYNPKIEAWLPSVMGYVQHPASQNTGQQFRQVWLN